MITLKIRPQLEAEARKRQSRGHFNAPQYKNNPVQAPVPELEDPAQARDKAAALVGVSPRTVQQVWTVAEKAPDLIPKLESGELSAKQVSKIGHLKRLRVQMASSTPPASASLRSSQRLGPFPGYLRFSWLLWQPPAVWEGDRVDVLSVCQTFV